MSESSIVFKAGTRKSPLALWQTGQVLERFSKMLPDLTFTQTKITTPGDEDRSTDLRESPLNFFTESLDSAVLDGTVDFAVHSAKDVPYPVAEGLDWFWLPDSGDRRDCLVGSLEPKTIGVSSERRSEYASKRFPTATQIPIRGNIEERIAQVDDGAFDLMLMAGVAMQRLGLEHRITEWVPLDELNTPEAQGTIAITFRKNDPRMVAVRNLFVKAVTFVGAGVCNGQCTLDGVHALQTAEICLYDALVDDSVLKNLPAGVKKIYVGKRRGAHSQPQSEINELLCDSVRQGCRTVRLKGGDSGIFGRLAEEVDALEDLSLASRVVPGISAMQTVASSTGLLLTRRGVARGFSVMTPRAQNCGVAPVDSAARSELPVIFFMAASIVDQLAAELMSDGMSGDTPCALIYGAGSTGEATFRSTLIDLPQTVELIEEPVRSLPGLFVVGEVARYGFDSTLGALEGQRVLLTCSEDLIETSSLSVRDFGGRPAACSLIQLERVDLPRRSIDIYDWIVLTSPSSVRFFHEWLLNEKIDVRGVPKIMSVGAGTERALNQIGMSSNLTPESDFSATGLLEVASPVVGGQRILRLRSRNAGDTLAVELRAAGAEVDDVILYENQPVESGSLPPFDSVFFASSSAVTSFVSQWGTELLTEKRIVTMGKPTAATLDGMGLSADVVGTGSRVEDVIHQFTLYEINRRLCNVS